jgi:hypothetical protein
MEIQRQSEQFSIFEAGNFSGYSEQLDSDRNNHNLHQMEKHHHLHDFGEEAMDQAVADHYPFTEDEMGRYGAAYGKPMPHDPFDLFPEPKGKPPDELFGQGYPVDKKLAADTSGSQGMSLPGLPGAPTLSVPNNIMVPHADQKAQEDTHSGAYGPGGMEFSGGPEGNQLHNAAMLDLLSGPKFRTGTLNW